MIRFHKRILMCTTADRMWLAFQVVQTRQVQRDLRIMEKVLVPPNDTLSAT